MRDNRPAHPLGLGVLLLVLACIAAQASAQAVDVWIDPGHGGSDPGNLGINNLPAKYEKNLAFQVSDVLHSRLGQLGFSSFLTRNSDIFFTLKQRADMASGLRQNDLGEQGTGQMLVSVHMNSAADTTVIGSETYYPRRKRYSKRLRAYQTDSTYAAAVHTNMMSQAPLAFFGCNSNRGVKNAGFQVIKDARVPGVLVEVCFLTNRCQQNAIAVQGNQALIANGIAAGIGQVISPGGFAAPPAPVSQPQFVSAADPIPELEASSRASHPAGAAIQSLSEDFESGTFPPTGWSTMTQGLPAPLQWYRAVAPLYAHGGTAAASVGGESPSMIDEWLISPLTLLGGSDTGLRFYWNGNRQFAQAANAECLVRPSGAGTWTQLWSLQSEPDGTEFQYRERVVDITPWVGSQVQFAFRVSGVNGAEFVVDDISTGPFAPTSTPTNDLCSGAIAIPGGTHQFTGSTCYATNNLDASLMPGGCSADSLSGQDVFFWLSAAAGDTLDATVSGPWSPVLSLVSGCSGAVGTCVTSAPMFQDGDITTASLKHVFSSPGVFFLVVDGVSGECGDFTLSTHIRSDVTGVDAQGSPLPRRPALHVWPNPSSGAVRFTGHRANNDQSGGTLRVFDIRGRLVLERSILISGDTFSEAWDGHGASRARLPSGVYVARLEVGKEVLIARFVLAQ